MKQGLLPGIPPLCDEEERKVSSQTPAESAQGDGHDGQHDDQDEGQEQWPALHDMMGSLFVFELDNPRPVPVEVLGLDAGHGQDTASPFSPAQQSLVDAAQVIAAGAALLDRCFPERDPHADGREYLPLRAPLEPVLQSLEESHRKGRRVLVLADGDPLFFGIGATLARRLPPSSLRFHPAVSSLQRACALAGLPWHDTLCVSLHGRDPVARWRPFNVGLMANRPLCVLTDAGSSPDILARHMLDRGVDWFTVWVMENLGSTEERCQRLSLRETASTEDFAQPCTVLLIPEAAPRRAVLGLPDHELAVEKGLITKAPVRAAALSLLRLQPEYVFWDVGSGSGAVALEACALCHEGCVVAVERSPGRALGIRENRRRFGAAILEVVTDAAPDCLAHLPVPDAVFVGGGLSGDNAEELLEELCHRLAPGGRLVVSCVLLGSLQLALDTLRRTGWPVEMHSVQAAEAQALAGDLRLVPFNPVFLVACQKPA